MLRGLGKGLLLRLGAYALFLWGFWLLYKAFGFSDTAMAIGVGICGGAAILLAMWLIVSFRRLPVTGTKGPDDNVKPGRTGPQDSATP